jgi:hypothetical protein
MIKEAMQYIQEISRPVTIEKDGRSYSTVDLQSIREPRPNPIQLHTLNGLVDYMILLDEAKKEHSFITVDSYYSVMVRSGLSAQWKDRDIYVEIKQNLSEQFRFGYQMDVEEFVVQLQSRFVETEMQRALLKLVGNLASEEVSTVTDDGISQQCVARSGIAKLSKQTIEPIIELEPYRTFREIPQPASKFLFRMQKGRENGLPTCALFEADGGAWQLEAIHSIKEYLDRSLPDYTIIA